MAKPTFIDIRAQKYFSTSEELENFKDFMKNFNMMNDEGEFTFNSNGENDVIDVYIETYDGTKSFYLIEDGERSGTLGRVGKLRKIKNISKFLVECF